MTSSVETQPERTALAWQRTGLGVLGVAGLLGHRAVRDGRPVLLVLAGVAALLGLVVLGGLAPARYRSVRRGPGARDVVAPRASAGVTVIVVLVGALAAVSVLLPR